MDEKPDWYSVTPMMLRKLFLEDNLSFKQIAALFENATRGKVAGKCRMFGLQKGTSPFVGRKREKEEAAPSRPLPPPRPLPRMEPGKPGTMKLKDLDAKACRWPFGDPRADDFGFCGMTSKPGSPYCREHAELSRVRSYVRQ